MRDGSVIRWLAASAAGLCLLILPLGTMALGAAALGAADLAPASRPGGRVLLDAHNCYPENDQWTDRLDRALSTGVPVAIEQDLAWYTDPATSRSFSIISHGKPYTGREPVLKTHFFERVRPIVERALADPHPETWPLIVLNLDFKSNEPAHHAAVWATLGEYEAWLTTAAQAGTGAGADARVMPLEVKPILVLTGSADEQERSFSTSLPAGAKLRLFGAIRVDPPARIGKGEQLVDRLVEVTPEEAVPTKATNYRRWTNYPWAIVERGGQVKAGDWTAADRQRLDALVSRAHASGLWIRFYTLNGHTGNGHAGNGQAGTKGNGWTDSYNFGSETAAAARWRAAMEAGVDFIATDQYEGLAALLKTRSAGALVPSTPKAGVKGGRR